MKINVEKINAILKPFLVKWLPVLTSIGIVATMCTWAGWVTWRLADTPLRHEVRHLIRKEAPYQTDKKFIMETLSSIESTAKNTGDITEASISVNARAVELNAKAIQLLVDERAARALLDERMKSQNLERDKNAESMEDRIKKLENRKPLKKEDN